MLDAATLCLQRLFFLPVLFPSGQAVFWALNLLALQLQASWTTSNSEYRHRRWLRGSHRQWLVIEESNLLPIIDSQFLAQFEREGLLLLLLSLRFRVALLRKRTYDLHQSLILSFILLWCILFVEILARLIRLWRHETIVLDLVFASLLLRSRFEVLEKFLIHGVEWLRLEVLHLALLLE